MDVGPTCQPHIFPNSPPLPLSLLLLSFPAPPLHPRVGAAARHDAGVHPLVCEPRVEAMPAEARPTAAGGSWGWGVGGLAAAGRSPVGKRRSGHGHRRRSRGADAGEGRARRGRRRRSGGGTSSWPAATGSHRAQGRRRGAWEDGGLRGGARAGARRRRVRGAARAGSSVTAAARAGGDDGDSREAGRLGNGDARGRFFFLFFC